MATQIIPHRPRTSNTPHNQARRQARLAEALRLADELAAAREAADANSGIRYSEIHYTTNPGPDYTPRPWR